MCDLIYLLPAVSFNHFSFKPSPSRSSFIRLTWTFEKHSRSILLTVICGKKWQNTHTGYSGRTDSTVEISAKAFVWSWSWLFCWICCAIIFFNHFPHHLCHCRFLVSVLGDRVLVPACVIPPIFVSLSVDASCVLLRTPFCYECAFLLEVFCHQESPSLRFFLWLSLILWK